MSPCQHIDVLAVGAGFGGLRALHSFRSNGYQVAVLERSDDVGGVWNYNRYPGARCDVESYDYSYSFSRELEQEWRWSERYATQPEILRYIQHVADRFDLRRDIHFNTNVVETASRWLVRAQDGRCWSARHLILAVGQLSIPKETSYPGQAGFRGRIIYSARWPREDVDLVNKRVAIIGTGSSGVQMTPVIAEQAAQLTVFQRTANYSIPAANAPISDEEDARIKSAYARRREQARNSPSGLGFVADPRAAHEVPEAERRALLEAAWNRLGFGFSLTFKDILLNQESNDIASQFIREKIAGLVTDPVTRDKLTPKGFAFGTRRPSVDNGYFQAFNRTNVRLVDIHETPIEEITATGIRTSTEELPFDVIIYATGFDVFTGALLKPTIVGRGGQTLREKWAGGPVSYLGLATSGFPNLYIIVGPGSPSLLSNVLLSSEEQIDWLLRLANHARDCGIVEIEATPEAESGWVEHVNERARQTLYLSTPSYYTGAEMPGKPQVFMPYSGGVRGYRRILVDTELAGYEGFNLRTGPARAVA